MAEMLYRHSTTVYEYSLCWFVNVFSNFLILRTFITEKRYQKQGILFKKKFILIIFWNFYQNVHFSYLHMCQLTQKMDIDIHLNNVFYAFLFALIITAMKLINKK